MDNTELTEALQPVRIKATAAVDLIEQRLQALEHPTAGVLRLTMFSHVSDGVRKLKRQLAESLVLLLENNGYRIHNGLTEAVDTLTAAGYTVIPPDTDTPAQSPTEPSLMDLLARPETWT
ncbi:hypothetical protein SEA_MPHALCON_145 [Mycobacterium phage MPhalcon]|uniref:Uncharacterized protein n=7 Tax=Viruses TaxID=10239 RepID=B5A6A6_9CAUD|nr:hypothetical protein Porky_146 [Mycobacterium phage Porky]YP_008052074.1 hypothetical protein PBI_PHRUX_140 [Mycobacterium phage Phrux]YP_008858872.1 hypothetical protein HUFFLYPUFF_145 [Mycobacterium phage HufflyPuff]YP_009011896.1 hypothetical protein LILAC_139 [Mycobacterium phage Lilac]YP_009197805.1 hypothetical protein SEA_NELITZAMV_139 [Mycobacterium phage NelitzaMV]YP_009613762.1 hypothetical protein FDI54_gp111 [Mycobacterium phage Pumpkin]AEK08987.1 hypothetical protein PBI_HENRY